MKIKPPAAAPIGAQQAKRAADDAAKAFNTSPRNVQREARPLQARRDGRKSLNRKELRGALRKNLPPQFAGAAALEC
jgi:hypothetical protein